MRTPKSVTGRIITLVARDTRYGRRAVATVEKIDWSTGEVTEAPVKAWAETAHDLEAHGLGATIGLTGTWRRLKDGSDEFLVRDVGALRHIDPRGVDVSAYL